MNTITQPRGSSGQNELILQQQKPLEQNAAAVYVASLPADSGKRTQAQALRVIAGIFNADVNLLNWGALRYQHTAAIRARLSETYSPASANKIMSALRQTLKQAWLLGSMTAEDYQRAANLKPITGETLPAGRDLAQGEILALMNACHDDDSPAGTRDAAIIGMMYAAGLRRAEVVSLTLDNFDVESGALKLTGKRNKQRTAYITGGALDALRDWLAIRGNDGSALFVAINKGGKLDTSKNINSQAIYNMLAKRATDAHIKEFSPHEMRRTFVRDRMDSAADCATVAKMADLSTVLPTV